MKPSSTFVSVVAPLHNAADCLGEFVADVLAVLTPRYQNFEIILVDNGSTDGSAAVAARLTREHAAVRLIRVARCLTPDVAALAGLESSIGDYVVVLRPDADPPAEIERVLQEARRDADVVQGVAVAVPGQGPLFRLCQAGFYLLCNRLLRLELPPPASSLYGFSRRAVNALARIRQKQSHLGLLGGGLGLPRRTLDYRKAPRRSTPGRYGLLSGIDRAVSLLVMHSLSPLRFISYVGVVAGALNLLYAVYVVGVHLVKDKVAEGWTTLSLQNTLMFFFVFLILVLMSEYLSRILEESKDRPLYHVLEELGSTSVEPGAGCRNVSDESPLLGNPDAGREDRHAA